MADHVFYFAATRFAACIPLGCVCCGGDALLATNVNGESLHLCGDCGQRELQALIDEAAPLSTERRREFERVSAAACAGVDHG